MIKTTNKNRLTIKNFGVLYPFSKPLNYFLNNIGHEDGLDKWNTVCKNLFSDLSLLISKCKNNNIHQIHR